MITQVILAGVNKDNAIRELIPSRASVTYSLVFFGALFLVGLAVFACAILFGPQRRRQRSHRRRTKPAPQHREKPEGFHRRPTLAEAGGLPPVRGERPPAPTA